MRTSHSIASLDRVIDCYQESQISEQSYHSAVEQITTPPSPAEWVTNLRHWFLVLGICLVVSGIIYFGAFNWYQLSRFEKLGLMEALFIGFSLAVLSRGLDSKEGPVVLFGAASMVGALLAVLGQVYQSGADSYLLFLAWAALIAPWCAIGRSNALWVLEFLLLNLSFCLYWEQTVEFPDRQEFCQAYLALNLALAGIWTWGQGRTDWMKSAPSNILLAAALTPLTLLCFEDILSVRADLWNVALLLFVLAALFGFRRDHLPSMVIVASSLLCLGTSLAIEIFMDLDILGLLLVALSIMAQLGLMVKWLTGVHRRRPPSSPAPEPIHTVEAPLSSPAPVLDIPAEELDLLTRPSEEPPWYFQLMVGTGAWISSLFVLAFFLVWIASSEVLLFLCGALIYGFSLRIRTAVEPSTFFRHSLLSTHLAAIMVTVAGATMALTHWAALPGLLAAVMLAMSARFYSDSLGRFLFGLGFVACGLWASVAAFEELAGVLWLVLVAGFLAWASLHLRTLLLGSLPSLYLPLLRGLGGGLLICTCLYGFDFFRSEYKGVLTIGILAVALWVSWKLKHPPLVLGGLLLLGFLTQSVPPLMASVLVYTLGFAIRQKLLQGLALVFLVASGSFFYYSLALTLAAKAATLVLSGILLLALRLFLRKGETYETAL